MTPLLSQQRIAVSIEGELVKLSIGNTDIRLPYEAALQLSQWLRVRGKEAKRNAGDVSRHWSAIGLIDGLK
jgi:hypothetical protein